MYLYIYIYVCVYALEKLDEYLVAALSQVCIYVDLN